MWRSMLLSILMLAGCVGDEPDLTRVLRLEIHNDTPQPSPVTFTVREPYGETIVYQRDYELAPGERILVGRVQLLEGPYRVRAEANGLTRDADVELGENASYRFVLLEQAIAFQKVGA